MAYITRSAQGVRQITPLSSRLRRKSEKFEGAAKAAIQMEAAKEAVYETKRGMSTQATRDTEDAAQRAIMAGQKMAIQGDFNPADIVSPLRQEFFDSASGLPQFKQAAILDKFTPEFRQQSLQNMQEQKSFLQLREAQRKARLTQAADALQVPVSQRIEQIMSSGDNNKIKLNNLQQSLFQNPEALGNPLVATLYDTAFKNVGDKLEARQKKKTMRQAQESNMIAQAVAAGNTDVINTLRGDKTKGGKRVYNTALTLAEATKKSKEDLKKAKEFAALIPDLRGADPNSFNEITSRLKAPTQIQEKQLALLRIKKANELQGITSDKQLEALEEFASRAASLLRTVDEFETVDDEDLTELIQLIVKTGITDEDFANLLGDDIRKLEDVKTYQQLLNLISAASAKLKLEGAAVDRVAQKQAQYGSYMRRPTE
tara:strand:+ start:3003 stop:4289 length:1287 start_codon:yes stop_codon:yes gene_type:complete